MVLNGSGMSWEGSGQFCAVLGGSVVILGNPVAALGGSGWFWNGAGVVLGWF
jgi:hypothetical protein